MRAVEIAWRRSLLGIGSSHSPMLSTPYEAFAGLADLDRARLPEFAAKARRERARGSAASSAPR